METARLGNSNLSHHDEASKSLRSHGCGFAVPWSCGRRLQARAAEYVQSILHLGSAYRLNVTIEVDGEQYSSNAISQLLRSRKWIAEMNSCPATVGTALAFRLRDNRLVLLSSGICQKAIRALNDSRSTQYPGDFTKAMDEHRRLDLTPWCFEPPQRRFATDFIGYDGFVIDNADHPARWRGFNFDSPLTSQAEHLRVVTATAEAGYFSPEDELDKVAPAILKTTFKYENWSRSPETIVSFKRRYDLEKRFAYTAEQEQRATPR